jgi:hypothetical protein
MSNLTYISRYKSMVYDMLIVWVDEADRIKDQVYRDDLLAMGYTIKWVGYRVQVTKGDFKTVFRECPAYEPVGRVSRSVSNQLVTEQ